MAGSVYCIDTSSLIECNLKYPESNFPGLWKRLRQLVDDDRLITTRQVRRELKSKADQAAVWVKDNKRMVRTPTDEEWIKAQEVRDEFPKLVDPEKEKEDADPFLIGLALVEREKAQAWGWNVEYVVVSEESTKRRGKDKIPTVCKHYGLRCIRLLQLIQEEGWRFP